MTIFNDKRQQPQQEHYGLFHYLSAEVDEWLSRFHDYAPVALTLILIAVALWGYRGEGAGRLGPPLGEITGQDFRNILYAASAIETGDNPYTLGIESGRSPNFKEFVTWGVGPYVYPPLMAVLARPLLRLPTEVALRLWSWISLALLSISAVLVVRGFTRVSFIAGMVRFFFILTLFFVFAPTQFDLMLGQADILILFLLMSTFLLYRRGNSVAGITLAFAIAIKPIVVPMLLFFLWKREWRISIITAVATALLMTLGFSLAGWVWLPDYIEATRQWSSGAIIAFPVNQSVKGLALRMFTHNAYIQPLYFKPWLAHAIPLLVGLLAVGSWLISVSRSDDKGKSIVGLEYGLTLTTLMLLSPLAEDIHFVWVLLPLSALLLVAIENIDGVKAVFPLVVSFVIALYLGYPSIGGRIYAGHETLLYHNELVERSDVFYSGLYLYGLIAVQVCLVIQLYVQRIRKDRLLLGRRDSSQTDAQIWSRLWNSP